MNGSNDKLARMGSTLAKGTASGLARALLVAISAFAAHAALALGLWTGFYGTLVDALAPVSAFIGLPADALMVLAISSLFNYYAAFGALAALAPDRKSVV